MRILRRRLARTVIRLLALVSFGVVAGPAANTVARPSNPSSGGNTIETVAGNGVPGGLGDGLPAVQAQVHTPTGVAADMAGNLYIADSANNRIREVSNPTTLNQDVINTVAGIGRGGFSGDGGPAVDAELQHPTSVTVDSLGDILVADSGNNRVRKVSAGTITTLAGNGTCSSNGATLESLCHPFGVAADANGNVYMTDPGHFEVKVVDAQGSIHIFAGTGIPGYSGDGGRATSARLGLPTGIALDSLGDVFIADSLDQVIREVLPSGIIETFAGTGHLGFSGDGRQAKKARLAIPTGVGTDALGDVFIADTLNNRIREVTPDGTITTVAGTGTFGFSGDGGPAATAKLGLPIGSLAVIGTAVYFSDTSNQRVRGIFMGPPPVLPETTFVFLLPVVAIVAGGGVFYWRRRRARPSVVSQ